MHCDDAAAPVLLAVLERVACDTARRLLGNKLQTFHDSWSHLAMGSASRSDNAEFVYFVFEARVLSFCVLADNDHINIIVRRFVAGNAFARTHVCI